MCLAALSEEGGRAFCKKKARLSKVPGKIAVEVGRVAGHFLAEP